MRINELIAELQALAAVMPCGGDNEVKLKVTKQVSDSKLEESYFNIDEVIHLSGTVAFESIAQIKASY